MFLVTRHLKPQNELGRLQHEVNRMLHGFLGNDPGCCSPQTVRGSVAFPKLDVSETDAAVQVSAELPGLKQEEIEIEVLADTLHISGEKKDERVVNDHRFHAVERSFGRFDRTIALPAEVDSKNAEATFKDGVLVVTLPKLSPVAAQKITVKTVT